jgi:hypothetical protein
LVELKILKVKKSEGGMSVYLAKKSITITSAENGAPVLRVTNEYGNSVTYEISDSYRFDNLLSNLWQFVRDSQH